MELKPVYKLIPTEDMDIKLDGPILIPENLEISIYKIIN